MYEWITVLSLFVVDTADHTYSLGFNPLNYLESPITPHATRVPEFPVFSDY